MGAGYYTTWWGLNYRFTPNDFPIKANVIHPNGEMMLCGPSISRSTSSLIENILYLCLPPSIRHGVCINRLRSPHSQQCGQIGKSPMTGREMNPLVILPENQCDILAGTTKDGTPTNSALDPEATFHATFHVTILHGQVEVPTADLNLLLSAAISWH